MAEFDVLEADAREGWLQLREGGIGGSDAAAILGLKPGKTNRDLYLEKTTGKKGEDISGLPFVQYGIQAEAHIRALFALDFPEYEVTHHDHRVLRSKAHPFLLASLDGELTDARDQRKGVLEIKTANILSKAQGQEWRGRIPANYYVQVLHYLLVTGWDFAVLCAHLRYDFGLGDRSTSVRHYHIDRQDVEADMAYLLEEETKFWRCVQERKMPPLVVAGL